MIAYLPRSALVACAPHLIRAPEAALALDRLHPRPLHLLDRVLDAHRLTERLDKVQDVLMRLGRRPGVSRAVLEGSSRQLEEPEDKEQEDKEQEDAQKWKQKQKQHCESMSSSCCSSKQAAAAQGIRPKHISIRAMLWDGGYGKMLCTHQDRHERVPVLGFLRIALGQC